MMQRYIWSKGRKLNGNRLSKEKLPMHEGDKHDHRN